MIIMIMATLTVRSVFGDDLLYFTLWHNALSFRSEESWTSYIFSGPYLPLLAFIARYDQGS
jgi:hypothetical protein